MAFSFVAVYWIASSQETSRHSSVIFSRSIGLVIRSECEAYPQAKRPFTQLWPSLAPPVFAGTIRTNSSPRSSALKEQPTPQYAQVVCTVRVGIPKSITDFSCNVAVGHACTQAPQETHSLDRKFNPPGLTLELKPRPSIVRARVPCTSSQARTHLLQTMHLLSSKEKYGLDESVGAAR